MVHFESKEKAVCVICIRCMCGTIIDNYFATVLGRLLSDKNIGFIYEHNRGHSIENDIVMKDGSFKMCGCMYEIFEDCIYDIDLPIESQIHKYQNGYYKAIANCNNKSDSTEFIEFMLRMIDEMLDEALTVPSTPINQETIHINKLLNCLDRNVLLSANKIMEKLNIKSKKLFRLKVLK